jgi:S1-C subfamily serine protease
VNDTPIASLQAFSTVLRGLQPGQRITVRYRRGERDETVLVTVTPR